LIDVVVVVVVVYSGDDGSEHDNNDGSSYDFQMQVMLEGLLLYILQNAHTQLSLTTTTIDVDRVSELPVPSGATQFGIDIALAGDAPSLTLLADQRDLQTDWARRLNAALSSLE
jgi:hypothetical protein